MLVVPLYERYFFVSSLRSCILLLLFLSLLLFPLTFWHPSLETFLSHCPSSFFPFFASSLPKVPFFLPWNSFISRSSFYSLEKKISVKLLSQRRREDWFDPSTEIFPISIHAWWIVILGRWRGRKLGWGWWIVSNRIRYTCIRYVHEKWSKLDPFE